MLSCIPKMISVPYSETARTLPVDNYHHWWILPIRMQTVMSCRWTVGGLLVDYRNVRVNLCVWVSLDDVCESMSVYVCEFESGYACVLVCGEWMLVDWRNVRNDPIRKTLSPCLFVCVCLSLSFCVWVSVLGVCECECVCEYGLCLSEWKFVDIGNAKPLGNESRNRQGVVGFRIRLTGKSASYERHVALFSLLLLLLLLFWSGWRKIDLRQIPKK